MLVNLKQILEDARIRGYGVGMFNTFNIEMALGVLEAAEETQSPVIFGTAEALLDCCDIDTAASFLVPMAKKASVPVALHLDHGYTEETLKHAIEAGFTSVMYDCSTELLEENIARCAEMAFYAHERGVSVEGELGHVAFDEGGEGEYKGYAYTEPMDVKEFVEKTKIDALAIAIGTEHGVYKSKPVLDIERLKEIRSITDTNLVLHGGSGLSVNDLQECIRYRIQKINIYTDISIAASEAAYRYVKQYGPVIDKISPLMREAVKKVAVQKMTDFGSVGKAMR